MSIEKENELGKLKKEKIKIISEKIAEFKKVQKDLLDKYVVNVSAPDIFVDNLDASIKFYNSKIDAIAEFENDALDEFIYNILFGDVVEAKINILNILNDRIGNLEKKIDFINVEISISSNSLVSKACVKLKKEKVIVYEEEIKKLRPVCSDLTSTNVNREYIKNIYLNHVIEIDKDVEYYTDLIGEVNNEGINQTGFEIDSSEEETLIEYKAKTFFKIINCYKKVNK